MSWRLPDAASLSCPPPLPRLPLVSLAIPYQVLRGEAERETPFPHRRLATVPNTKLATSILGKVINSRGLAFVT